MDISLFLNNDESETGVSTSGERSSKDEPIPSPLAHSAELRQRLVIVSSLRPYISYQAQNLRRGPCTIHPISPPQRRSFSPEEDALMQYLIDIIQISRIKILGICLNRSNGTVNTRRDVLDSYEPCSTCIQCQQFQKRIEELRRRYVSVSSRCTIHYCLIVMKLPRVRLGDYAPFPEYKDLCGNSSASFY
jgi:hypothetical protein